SLSRKLHQYAIDTRNIRAAVGAMGIKMTSTRAMMAATVAFGAAVLVGVPSAGLALEGLGQAPGAREWKGLSSFTPATVDPDMARLVAERGTEVRMSRFTPAGMSTRANRSMTVAVRVN